MKEMVKSKYLSIWMIFVMLLSGCYNTVSLSPPASGYNLGDYGLADMQIGDFYIKSADGSTGFVYPREASSLPDVLSGRCIGVVLKASRDNTGKWADNCSYKLKDGSTPMTTVNGYLLVLRDANDGNRTMWCTDDISLDALSISTNKSSGFFGYQDQSTVKEYATANGKDLQTCFPAVYWASAGYDATCMAPPTTSGWFLPSAKQCLYWADHRDLLLSSIRKAPGNNNARWDYYWTTSKYTNVSSWVTDFNCSSGSLSGGNPSSDFPLDHVRALLVF